jgi:hypothetical protein
MNFNQWANYVGFGSMYKSPSPPPPNCHYFDTKVFKQSLTQNKNKSVMRTLKKLFGLAVILSVMASCNTIRNVGGGGCGVWMPKKYTGMPKQRGGARIPTF